MARRGRNEGGVTYLSSRKVWVASVYVGQDEKGKAIYRKKQRKTKVDATKALNELRLELASGRPVVSGGMSVEQWLERWLEEFIGPQRAPKTYSSYEQIIRLHLGPGLGKIELTKLDPKAVAVFFAKKHKQFEAKGGAGHGLTMLKNMRAVLRSALKRAVALGFASYCPVNEATSVPPVRKRESSFLTPEQCAQLLAALEDSPIRSLVQFVMATGLRVGEATGLRWSDIDKSRKVAKIEVQLQRVKSDLVLRQLKTEKSRRELPLNSMALDALDRASSIPAVEGGNQHGVVFVNSHGGPFDPKNVDVWLKRALVSAGLPSMGMHGLRHAAATTLLQNGVPLHTVSRMLGHSSITLTANTYGHVLDASHIAASDVLSAAISRHIQG